MLRAWYGVGLRALITILIFTTGLSPAWFRSKGATTLRDEPEGASLAVLGLRKA